MSPESWNPRVGWVGRSLKGEAGVAGQAGSWVTCQPCPSPCTRGCWGALCCRRAQSDNLGTQTTHQSRASGGGTGAGAPSAWEQKQQVRGTIVLQRNQPSAHQSSMQEHSLCLGNQNSKHFSHISDSRAMS